MDNILTVNDVAEILKVKPITVREMFRENRLRAFKVGKAWRTTEHMLQEDIDYLARGESPPPLNPEGEKPTALAKDVRTPSPAPAVETPKATAEVCAAPETSSREPEEGKSKPAPKPEQVDDNTPQGLLF